MLPSWKQVTSRLNPVARLLEVHGRFGCDRAGGSVAVRFNWRNNFTNAVPDGSTQLSQKLALLLSHHHFHPATLYCMVPLGRRCSPGWSLKLSKPTTVHRAVC